MSGAIQGLPVELDVVLRRGDNRERFSQLPGEAQREHIQWIADATKKDVRLRRAAHVAKKLQQVPMPPVEPPDTEPI